MEQHIDTPQNTNNHPKNKKPIGLWVSIILNVLLLAVIAWLWWQLQLCMQQEAKLNDDKKQLQSQVEDLKKQLAAKGAATADTSTCKGTVSQSLKDNIEAAVNSKNTAALEGYMTNPVKAVIAGSEYGKNTTPADAIANMGTITGATGPWNFALPTATLTSYKAGFYKDYFGPNSFVGKAASEQVVSFDFDSCGKINQVFMSVSADLLL